MKPWGAEMVRPSPDELRLLSATMTDQEIADRYGVTRPAVAYWRKAAGISKDTPERLSHKKFIPWTVAEKDGQHHFARMLRAYSTRQQGKPVRDTESKQLDALLAFLDEEGLVIDYDREKGWGYRRRLPSDTGIIREPDTPDDI